MFIFLIFFFKVHAKLLTKSKNPPAQSKFAAYLALQNYGVPVTAMINNYDHYSYCDGIHGA